MKYVSFLAAGILSLTISCNSATEQKDAGATDAAVIAAGQSAAYPATRAAAPAGDVRRTDCAGLDHGP